MTLHLVVKKSFMQFVRGDIIAEPAVISGILETEHRLFVTKVAKSSTSKG